MKPCRYSQCVSQQPNEIRPEIIPYYYTHFSRWSIFWLYDYQYYVGILRETD